MITGNEKDLFTWKVFTEYVEEEKEISDGLGHFNHEVFIKGKGECREYSPLEYYTLYAEFQRIYDKQDVLEFIQKFGLPNSTEEETLKNVLLDAQKVRECLRLYNALKKGLPLQGIELEELQMKDRIITSERLKRFNKEKVLVMELEKWGQIVIEEMKAATKYRTPEQGREALMEHINKRLGGVKPVLLYGKEGFTFGQTCGSLLQYIYLQVFDHVSRRKDFVQCLDCGSWFSPTKAGMKFCPPLPGKKKSSCANRFYVRENRKNNRGF